MIENEEVDALIDAIHNDKLVEKAGELFTKLIDGKNVDKNFLINLPESKMTLYGFSGIINSEYFDTKEELKEWMKNNDTSFGEECIIEYLGNVAGKSDVIKVTYKTGISKLYIACDEYGYCIYNDYKSYYQGEFVWEYNNGSLNEMYTAFRNRGIIFENDIYDEIRKRNENVLKYFKEKK